jgi:hypothetical protein
MKTREGRVLAFAVMLALGACSSGSATTDAAATSPASVPAVVDITPTILDVLRGETVPFTDLGPGRYALDPDLDPSTPLRVSWEVAAEGWKTWIGAAKFSDAGHVGLSITTVSNLVSDGCTDHAWTDPPVGPSVDDLATGLAALAPFRVTSPPEDVSIAGYGATHLELTVPRDQPISKDGNFVGCEEGKLKSWVAAIDAGEEGDAFYGYTGPGYHEEFWILDVEGTRLMIVAGRSADSPSEDLDQLGGILDHIRIEP